MIYKIRNKKIRKELGIQPVSECIEQRQLEYWEHLLRMENTTNKKNLGSKNNKE